MKIKDKRQMSFFDRPVGENVTRTTHPELLLEQIIRDEKALKEGGWGSEEFFRERINSYRVELTRLKGEMIK